MKAINIFPIAFDSFGVRSMSTFVKAGKLGICIDPGVALGPKRYGLPPAKEEHNALDICRKKIMEIAEHYANVIFVSHYHYDHHPFPDDTEMYKKCFSDKIVLAKDRMNNVNLSGKRRGKMFEDNIKDIVKSLEWADSKDFEFEGVRLSVSPAVWHGDVGSKVGKVVMLYIEKGKDSFLFGSDAQGLADPKALGWFIEKNPKFAILDGYPTIFVGWRMSAKAFEKSKENLKKAISETQVKTIILEHHILRDIKYKEKIKDILDLTEKLGKNLLTAAEFCGMSNMFLEAWRKKLHRGETTPDIYKYFRALHSKFMI
ncbi:MAG: MBL fold metallo-hydrolase [Candidatus Aenigmarchaeota archaeon]|nr:MBL fold metallo-hydrolase [Candidatus Aenigmarchaeota archaeon]